MTTSEKLKWKLHKAKSTSLTLWGLKNKKVFFYNDKLIEKLRETYYGGIPASIILLSRSMSNGHCYDRATLLAQSLLDEDFDVQLVYGTVDSIRLQPGAEEKIKQDPLYADHCFVEITYSDGQQFIVDTSTGLIYDKELYWKIEHPKVRHRNSKQAIREFVSDEEYYNPEDIERDKYITPIVLPLLEETYNRPNEIYAVLRNNLLQREIELFKDRIKYDDICREVDEDMKRVGLRKR